MGQRKEKFLLRQGFELQAIRFLFELHTQLPPEEMDFLPLNPSIYCYYNFAVANIEGLTAKCASALGLPNLTNRN